MAQDGMIPQVVMTMPLLGGIDAIWKDGVLVGPKMSKSLGNHVGLADDPDVQFRRLMTIDDSMIHHFTDLLGLSNFSEEARKEDPKGCKKTLASMIVSFLHDPSTARTACRDWESRFEERVPVTKDIIEVKSDGPIWICKAIVDSGLVPSTSKARQLVEGGACLVTGEKVIDPKVTLKETSVLQIRFNKQPHFVLVNIKSP